ncbi:hypothetical protein A3A93_02920 [Candidatus Roizmanbacteria bacterium RIFCSPLOWO2_01_FULL_38_12]|uniref:Uncharacterized protein n=1 Tax=Candidatus Roizmanbacteria bacterium RIFCSPLOWO2_01_FULL_38_12 TaxID=1802061 RepID=A0A1F7IZH0_9BACT|nr:MAG: hypothetical protein A3F59_06010 [Candidatus Roizmanbacteria bacterium RIFCSPHIGHO2_12_FULL_38_13]OGK48759.1 MAG: hypothetical protein A3A93_02920 [Candidatus Roizmanbacteria bacterium RIFCSPLOWO2_01_FULL_38_12]
MQQEIISHRLFFTTIIVSIIVIFTFFISNIKLKKTIIALCNEDGKLTVYMRLDNKFDILINPKSQKEVLGCIGKYMPFYDRTIEMILTDSKDSQIVSNLATRYKVLNVDLNTDVNIFTRNKISYDNSFVHYRNNNQNYLVLLKQISPFQLLSKVKYDKYTLVFIPEYDSSSLSLVNKIKFNRVEVKKNSQLQYLLN